MRLLPVAAAWLVGMIVVLLLLRTPEWLAHHTWNERITRTYRVDGEKQARCIRYNHAETDGVLLHQRLSRSPLPRIWCRKTFPPQCDVWARVRVGPSTDDVRESPFLRLVSLICRHTKMREAGTAIRSATLVSTRHKLPKEERAKAGSFIRSATLTLDASWSRQEIADANRASIQKVLDEDRLCDTLVERMAMLSTHFVFNKWMLDTIERDDGKTLRLQRGGQRVSLGYILDITMPLDIKCVHEGGDLWSLLVTPLWMTTLV